MKCKNCKNFEPKTETLSGKIQAGPNEVNIGTFQPSFQTITILRGPQGSGKTTEAMRLAGNRQCEFIYFGEGNDTQIISSKTEILIFDDVVSMKEIKKIINSKLPEEEIIICTTL